MSLPLIRLAVVGHTNTGKTSLLRTLTRNVSFGEVSPHPATTRHVEGTSMMLDGEKVVELFDTPGLEDSIGLLDHLEDKHGGRRADDLDQIREFLECKAARKRFAQEAKALRQVIDSDIALYVIDARDRVLGKHRDELEILSRCATPVVPVLNFTADSDAKVPEWRDHLARVNMHAVAEFDTVVVGEESEQRLYEKMRTLLDSHAATLNALIADRRRLRDALVRASADLAADLLIDVAAYVVPVPASQPTEEQLEALRQRVRDREQQCVEQLLALHEFRVEDYETENVPLVHGRWGLDLFSPEAIKSAGLTTGRGAVAGAVVGLVLDAMVGGASLGAGAAAGAAVGGLLGAGKAHGRRLIDRARGTTELRCDDVTLRLLALRQITLIRALLRRGHAAVGPVKALSAGNLIAAQKRSNRKLPAPLLWAATAPGWSHLAPGNRAADTDPRRANAQARLATMIAQALRRPAESPLEFP